MAEKSFGVKEINLIGASGTPTIESPNNLNLNAVNVAISTNVSIGGTLTVTGNVSVGGTLTYEDVTNVDAVGVVTAREGIRVGAGKSIGSDGAAVVYYGDGSNLTGISGGGGSGFTPDAQGNLVAGTDAGASFSGTDANHNILIGYEAGNALTTADNNVAIGYEALKSADTEGGNVAIGYRAMKEMTGFGGNVCIGYEAGYYTYGLWDCVAIGKDAMQKPVQSGYTRFSVAVGVEAMAQCGASNCVAIGYEALLGNNAVNSVDNTAVGYQSLTNITTAALKNTAVGSESGKATTSGDKNIYIGYNAGNNAHTTGDNCIIIGSDAAASSASASNEVSIGNTSITKFRIPGIGVTFTSTTGNSFSSDGQFVTSRWTVANNGSSNYTFTGPGGLSSASNSTLYLARGQTYEFNMNASGHGFGIQTSSGGWNASNEYTTGITNAKAAVGVIKFEVPFSAPNTLYYACTSGHSGMVGSIVVYPSI